MSGPLAGTRVLDLTRVVMGPLATQILADQGAEVILVEDPRGETSRVMGPGPHPELSGVALNLLRGKRSVALDLADPSSTPLLHRLVATCDVVVTTMRPRALRKLGVDYESLAAVRSDLVYCQAQGFATGSGSEDEPAYDDVIQAATGVVELMERAHGQPGLMPTILADKVSGLAIAQAVTAALFHRARTGEGQRVEVAMEQAFTAFLLCEHGAGAIAIPEIAEPGAPAAGYGRLLAPDRRPHPTKDGLILLLPYRPADFDALFREVGRPGREDDPRLADQRTVVRHTPELYAEVRDICRLRTTAEWGEFCARVGIPMVPIARLADVIESLPVHEHPVAGRYRSTPVTALFDRTPATPGGPAPLTGQDTDAVLAPLRENG